MKVEHYARVYLPGAFVSDLSVVKIDKRDISAVNIPKNAIGVEIFDIVKMESEYNGKTITFKSEEVEKDYYPIGKVVTLEEVGKEYGTDSMAYQNLVVNGYEYALKTTRGRLVFLNKEDVDSVIDPDSIAGDEAERD